MSLQTADITSVIIAFEHVLLIDQEQDTGKAILSARQRLESNYQLQLKDNIFEIQRTNLNSDAINQLLAQVTACLKDMALLNASSMFTRSYAVNLYDVRYLGFAKESLLVALRYLQDDLLYEKRNSFIPSIIKGTSRLDASKSKRLLTIMLVLESLGIKEGVAIVASYLYLGSI